MDGFVEGDQQRLRVWREFVVRVTGVPRVAPRVDLLSTIRLGFLLPGV